MGITTMKRFTVLWKKTWWLWSTCLIVTLIASVLLTPIMLCILPMLLVVFFYFALARYDDEGNFIKP
jgi:uncharacterized membrane protein